MSPDPEFLNECSALACQLTHSYPVFTQSVRVCVWEYILNRINYFSPTFIWNCCFFFFLNVVFVVFFTTMVSLCVNVCAFFLSYLSRWCQIVIIVYFLDRDRFVWWHVCCCHPKCVRCSRFGNAQRYRKCSIWKAVDIFHLVVIADKRTGVLYVCRRCVSWILFCVSIVCEQVCERVRAGSSLWSLLYSILLNVLFFFYFYFFHPLFSLAKNGAKNKNRWEFD